MAIINIIERLRMTSEPASYFQLARDLGVPQHYVSYWRRIGYIPEERALEIERLERSDTYGQINARAVLEQADAVKRLEEIPLMPENYVA